MAELIKILFWLIVKKLKLPKMQSTDHRKLKKRNHDKNSLYEKEFSINNVNKF